MQMKKTSEKRLEGIRGWLLVILLVCIYPALSASYLLIQRINAILTKSVALGVYISAVLLFVYCFFIWLTVYMIFNKKKKAASTFVFAAISGTVFSFWFLLISQLIYYPAQKSLILSYNLPIVIINLAVTVTVLLYLKKSERARNTLIKWYWAFSGGWCKMKKELLYGKVVAL